MSLRAMVWAFEQQEIMKATHKFVLVAMANYANDTGKVYPSLDTLVRITRLDKKTIRLAIDTLLESGHLTDTGQRAGGTAQIVVYQLPEEARDTIIEPNIRVPKTGALSSKRVQEASQIESRKGAVFGSPSILGEQGTGNKDPECAGAQSPRPDLFDEVIQAWNCTSSKALPKVVEMSKNRKRALNQRLTEKFFVDNYLKAIELISRSEFCTGNNKRGWKATFDFFLRPGVVVKAIEGAYSNRNSSMDDPSVIGKSEMTEAGFFKSW